MDVFKTAVDELKGPAESFDLKTLPTNKSGMALAFLIVNRTDCNDVLPSQHWFSLAVIQSIIVK